jgi:DNA polymerase
MNNEFKIDEINRSIKKCKKCSLYKTTKNYVLGSGSVESKIVFIGEAPGYYEDIKGIPFVGKAGKILDKLLASINMPRENIYITNILKCRPPNNRNPLKNEIQLCTKYLNEEINIIKPKIILPLGNFASSYVFDMYDLKFEKISLIHGNFFKGNSDFGKVYIAPQYHPAVGVYNQNKINTLIKDFEIIKNILNQKIN